MSLYMRKLMVLALVLGSVDVASAQVIVRSGFPTFVGPFSPFFPGPIGIVQVRTRAVLALPPVGPSPFFPIWQPSPVVFIPTFFQPPVIQQPPIIIQNVVQAQGQVPVDPVERNGAIIPADVPARKKAPAKLPPLPPAAMPKGPVIPSERVQSDRAVDAGRKAFAKQEYGRALELFRRAAVLTPKEPSIYFQIAQAQFALGKYHPATEAIRSGIAVRPDWSSARYSVRDLYDLRPTLFDEQMKNLLATAEKFPNDPALQFLIGHQLWFDDRAGDARPFLKKADEMGKGESLAKAFAQ
jgi:hypothetical protein